jgi:hypothetical protein
MQLESVNFVDLNLTKVRVFAMKQKLSSEKSENPVLNKDVARCLRNLMIKTESVLREKFTSANGCMELQNVLV